MSIQLHPQETYVKAECYDDDTGEHLVTFAYPHRPAGVPDLDVTDFAGTSIRTMVMEDAERDLSEWRQRHAPE